MPQKCINHPDTFCCICGSFTVKAQWHTITSDLQKLYQLYFGCPLDQNKDWAPHVICTSCSNWLCDWMNKRKTAVPLAIPMIWWEPKNLVNDCYLCCVSVIAFSANNKHKIVYSHLNSSWWQFTSSRASREWTGILRRMEFEDTSSPETIQHSSNDQYVPEERTSEPTWFNQQELNDLNRDLSLSIDKADLLASNLKGRNLLENDVRVCQYWIQNNVLKTFYMVDGPMVFCHDISCLFKGLKQEHNPSYWWLFIDSSWWSLKSVLHNGNSKPSIPVAHSVHVKESYGNMKTLLEAIQCNVHQWNICGDLKVTGMLMGMQGGFMKFFCFLCLWDSHSAVELYIKCA